MRSLFNDAAGNVQGKVIGIYTILLAFNVAAWLWALVAFRHFPLLLGTAFLAYSFGLRHAVDADHIAAIDNVTRKLMQEGKRPVSIGFLFSLGHSTIVVIGSVAIATTALLLQHRVESFRSIGGIIGTLVSTLFLFGIAAANLLVLRSIYAVFTRVRAGGSYVEEDLDLLLRIADSFRGSSDPCSRRSRAAGTCTRLAFSLVWDSIPLQKSDCWASPQLKPRRGSPPGRSWFSPALFAAGMSLIDTTDNILMLGAYGWAFVKPVRKLYYNLTITFVSVIVALVVGGIEALGLLAGEFRLNGVFWDTMRKLNENFGTLGYFIIALFALSWILSIAVYRWRRYDELEVQAEVSAKPISAV